MTLNRFDCLRRLRLLLPLQARSYLCGRPLDVLGHHRAECFKWLGPGECCSPCLPGSGRACQNESAVRVMDLGAHIQLDGGRLEIVVDCHCGWVSVGSSWIEVQSRQRQRSSHQPTNDGGSQCTLEVLPQHAVSKQR